MPFLGDVTPGRDPATARQIARGILSRPEFRPPYVSPIQRLRHWVGQQLAKALDSIVNGHFTAVGAVLLVVVVAVLVWWIVRTTRAVHRDAGSGVVVAPLLRPPADWLAEAVACEGRRDWRGALRARYRALVAELARRGLVEEIPGRTSGEYGAEVGRSLPGRAGEFSSATALFERTVYGDVAAGPDDVGRIKQLADQVMAGAR